MVKQAQNNKLVPRILMFTVFICFFCIAYSFLDPDFPWHLRFGSEILQHGINFKDQYSYTMPSFPFVDHSWLTSVIFSFIYSNLNVGYVGVALLCATIATTATVIAANGIPWLIPLIAESYLYGFGVRSHVVTFFFIITLIAVLKKYLLGNKIFLYLVPFILFLWTNMHGGFVLGVIYIWGLFLLDFIILKKKLFHTRIHVFLIFLFSTLVTFLTPYGIDIWKEALRTIGNPLLTKYISEWQPMSVYASFGFFMLVVLFFISVWYRRRVGWLEVFATLLCFDSFMSVRIVTLFCGVVAFIIADNYKDFLSFSQKRIDQKRLQIVTMIMTILTTSIFLGAFLINLRARLLVTTHMYPNEATEFLKKHKSLGNIFSIIHWNNYLLWQIPDRKVFIDGRMMVWSQPKKQNELESAFSTYIQLTLTDEPLQPIFDQYCISTILWTNSSFNDGWVKRIAPINITQKIDLSEWKTVYTDFNAVIYERPLPKSCKSS